MKLPLWIKLLVLAGVAVLAWAALQAYDERRREEGRAEVREQARQAAEAQTARNHELQRAAEKRYVVQAEPRERFITQTITEVRYATQSLATCPVPEHARGLLHRAAGCARGDFASAGCSGEPVHPSR